MGILVDRPVGFFVSVCLFLLYLLGAPLVYPLHTMFIFIKKRKK